MAGQVKGKGWQEEIDDLISRMFEHLNETPAAPACWCAIVDDGSGTIQTLQGGEPATTNNRMEMLAVIHGLNAVPDTSDVHVYSDSQYICKAFNNGWLRKWQSNGWRTANGAVLNQDLWFKMLRLVKGDGQRKAKFQWVKGHAGDRRNNQADRVAREAAAIVRRTQVAHHAAPIISNRED